MIVVGEEESEVVSHCRTWPRCPGVRAPKRVCDCQCRDCATVDTFDNALLFEATNHSVYAPGTMVEAIGIGKNDPRDDPGEFSPGMWIYGRGLDDDDKPVDPEDNIYWMYFRAGDLRPLTPAAKKLHSELLRRNRHMPRHHR